MTLHCFVEDIVEALEPEGEVGALTRAVLEYRDAHFAWEDGLEEGRSDFEPLRAAAQQMIALAEAIAASSRDPA